MQRTISSHASSRTSDPASLRFAYKTPYADRTCTFTHITISFLKQNVTSGSHLVLEVTFVVLSVYHFIYNTSGSEVSCSSYSYFQKLLDQIIVSIYTSYGTFHIACRYPFKNTSVIFLQLCFFICARSADNDIYPFLIHI